MKTFPFENNNEALKTIKVDFPLTLPLHHTATHFIPLSSKSAGSAPFSIMAN